MQQREQGNFVCLFSSTHLDNRRSSPLIASVEYDLSLTNGFYVFFLVFCCRLGGINSRSDWRSRYFYLFLSALAHFSPRSVSFFKFTFGIRHISPLWQYHFFPVQYFIIDYANDIFCIRGNLRRDRREWNLWICIRPSHGTCFLYSGMSCYFLRVISVVGCIMTGRIGKLVQFTLLDHVGRFSPFKWA